METLIVLGGALLFLVLLMASIAFHELGHLSFAKLFKVRTPQYMVGFGPTIKSWRRGETEYGIKWIPLGGYIRMIGMLPPRKDDPEGMLRNASTGRFQMLIDSAREGALEEVGPGDRDRVFYSKKWWQKLLIMFAGPAANLLLAVVFFAILIMGFGTMQATPVISSVAKCTIPAAEAYLPDGTPRECTEEEAARSTPAALAGLKPGDRFISFGGHRIEDYPQLQELIRDSANTTVPVVVERDGQRVTTGLDVTANRLPDLDDPERTVTVGFIGITPLTDRVQGGPGDVLSQMGDMTARTLEAFVNLPQKMVGVWHAAFSGDERDPEGPIGVVGASRLGGEILASENPGLEKITWFVGLLASLNFAVGMFNLIPLLPLDGGHIAGALWEGVKRGGARLLRRPDPGYVDVAKLLPLTYAMSLVLLVMGALLVYADLINPVRLM
ncbi:site-2 protease family protein [Actinocorallia sp. API 0066]|uniref:M50 family metallopeptidase n=1 Tax=Actinocorallia sp. API 0066 TaxID=2896846 RepID=UPI001E2A5834|nr:site-2 protease family protein [Actinocorallia sp. API 0066]MCD0451417.1 site-2 protease family protein [Actinocorallia sp. API 0066]